MRQNMLSQAQDRYWFGFGQHKKNEVTPREAANLAFMAGARWATKTEGALAPHIAQFCEMMVLLGYFDAEPEADLHAFCIRQKNRCEVCRRAGGGTPGDSDQSRNGDVPAMPGNV